MEDADMDDESKTIYKAAGLIIGMAASLLLIYLLGL
jgi:hypothetical protein